MTAIAKARANAILDMVILLVWSRNWLAYEVVIVRGRRIGGLAVIGADLRQSARAGDTGRRGVARFARGAPELAFLLIRSLLIQLRPWR
jgi:hypothetical protein